MTCAIFLARPPAYCARGADVKAAERCDQRPASTQETGITTVLPAGARMLRLRTLFCFARRERLIKRQVIGLDPPAIENRKHGQVFEMDSLAESEAPYRINNKLHKPPLTAQRCFLNLEILCDHALRTERAVVFLQKIATGGQYIRAVRQRTSHKRQPKSFVASRAHRSRSGRNLARGAHRYSILIGGLKSFLAGLCLSMSLREFLF
ncbi:MAG: hypothetical protein DMG10_16890 [Acidobacteria bacterium]|nr:MAG: hypothetical protein DMG10_16890 [Acidobacteriota bacterium]